MIITQAPAKVNLRLLVGARRGDGFHEIDSLLAPLELHDELRIARRAEPGVGLRCDGLTDGIPEGDENLVHRSARQFLERTRQQEGLDIALTKNIPSRAGLGGGSSDAASVLMAANQLFDSPLGFGELRQLAAGIGSDVPFFLLRGAGRCRGRGEIIEPATVAPRKLILARPAFGVSTAWAYRRFSELSAPPNPGGFLVNSLEAPVFEKFLLLADLKAWLLERPETDGALLCGSGSTVFAILRPGADGTCLGAELQAFFGATMWVRITRIACGTAKY